MKRPLFFLFFIIVVQNLIAQQKLQSFAFFNNIYGKRIVVVDEAILHVGPSAGAAFTDTLHFGDTINILMQVPYFESINELEVPWFKITYFKKGYTKVSYILGNDISLIEEINCSNYKCYVGFNNSIIKSDDLINQNENNILSLFIVDSASKKNISFILPKGFNTDSIFSKYNVNSTLKKTNGFLDIAFKANSIEQGSYFFKFVFCKESNVVQLPLTHSFQSEKENISECLEIVNQNYFEINSVKNHLKNSKTVVKYNWKDCNFFKQ